MNPYQHQCTCSICGEPGVAHVKDAGAEWIGGYFTHSNPSVCAENIRFRRERDQLRKEQAQTMEGVGAGI